MTRPTLPALTILTGDSISQRASVDRATSAVDLRDGAAAALPSPSVAKRRRSFGALKRFRTLSGATSKPAEALLAEQLALAPMSNGVGPRSRPTSGVESKRSSAPASPTKRRSASNLQGPSALSLRRADRVSSRRATAAMVGLGRAASTLVVDR